MRERDRISSLQHRQELAQIEAAEQERINAPIIAAEKALQETHRQLRAVEAERVTKMKDESVYMGELAGARMTQDEAIANNQKAVNSFLLECHEYREKYKTDTNRDQLLAYLDRNGVNLWSVAILRAAFTKLRDLRLLEEKPPAPVEQPVLNTPEPEPETPSGPTMHAGFDDDGRPKQFTNREVNLMSSTEFRRAFQVKTADLDLRGWGPGPRGLGR